MLLTKTALNLWKREVEKCGDGQKYIADLRILRIFIVFWIVVFIVGLIYLNAVNYKLGRVVSKMICISKPVEFQGDCN
jgi:hypothetical protein